MHVEFLGLPGAGKTTMSRAVAAALRERRIPVTEPTYRVDHKVGNGVRQAVKLWYSLRRMIRRPLLSARWARTVLGSHQRALGSSWLETANLLYLLELIRSEAARPGVHLFDQGLFQALWSLAYDSASPDVIPRLVLERVRRSLPRTAVVVVVEASVTTVRARLLERPGTTSRLQRALTNGRSAAAFATATAVLRCAEAAAGELARDGRIHVLRVSNESDAELPQGVARVADALSRLLREASPAIPIAEQPG